MSSAEGPRPHPEAEHSPLWWLLLVLAAEGLSFSACGYLLCKLCSLGETARNRLFPRQLVQLAVADIVFGVGATVQDILEFGDPIKDAHGHVHWSLNLLCQWSNAPYIFGRSVSILTEVHIAVSFACAAAQAEGTFQCLFASLRWLWMLGLTLAASEIWWLYDRLAYDRLSQKCAVKQRNVLAVAIFALAFAAMLGAYGVLLNRALRIGGKVTRAGMQTFVFPLVFLISYGLIGLYYATSPTYSFGAMYLVAQCLQHLNGFLNVVAYFWCSHMAWRLSEGRLLASPWAAWAEWPSRQVGAAPAGAAAQRRLVSVRDESTLLLQTIFYLEGSNGNRCASGVTHTGTCQYDLPYNNTTLASTTSAMCAIAEAPAMESVAQVSLVAPPAPSAPRLKAPLSAFVWRRPAGSFWRRAELAPGLFLQAFEPLRSLGAGVFGSVMLAEARADFGEVRCGHVYAVKLIRAAAVRETSCPHPEERDTLRSVRHPGIVTLYEALRLQPPLPSWVLVMEFCPGGDLSRKLEREGVPGLELPVALRHAGETLEALCYLHSRQIMHRDLKPLNVLLSATDHCKLSDFGVAVPGTRSRSCADSYGYLAPEVLQTLGPEPYTFAADLYSWGRVVEFMFTSHLHFDPASKLAAMQVPDEVIALVCQATSRKPQARGSAEDLRRHICFKGVRWESLFRE